MTIILLIIVRCILYWILSKLIRIIHWINFFVKMIESNSCSSAFFQYYIDCLFLNFVQCDWWNPENSWFEFHCFSKRRPSKHFASTSLASWGFNPLKHIDWIHLIVYQTKVVVLIPSASMWWDERKMSWNECMKQCSILRCTKWSINIIHPTLNYCNFALMTSQANL